MSEKKTKWIAVCSAGMDENYNEALWKAFCEYAQQFHFKILFFNSFSSLYDSGKHDMGEANIFHLMNYHLLDGIIMLTEMIKDDTVRQEIVERASQHKIPVVSLDQYLEGCYNINFRYSRAMEEIVTHLVEKHHYKRINFIAGLKDNAFSDDRLNAYKRVLERHHIPVEEGRIGYGGFWSVPTEQVVREFIQSDLAFPEAIVCANDTMALTAYKYLSEAGYHIPEDVAVTGFDGIEEALEHSPSITTAKQDFQKTARIAFEILDRVFQGEEPETQIWVDSKIIYGSSCGCTDTGVHQYKALARDLYEQINAYDKFNRNQIAMTADLMDNDTFQGLFADIMQKYSEDFYARKFWLCVVDDFLIEKEALTDIIEEAGFKRMGYSGKMDIMLSRYDGEWMGIMDFNTSALLPNLPEVFETNNNVMFLPLHVLEQTIGYVALVYEPDVMRMKFTYPFFMNISNAMEATKIRQRQQAIINNLEIKYVHDPMTGLFNRRGFYQRLTPVYESCVRDNAVLLVVSVDLNGLKQINDTYGHADGDIAISTIGRALHVVSPEDITCACFGGDEFVAAGKIGKAEDGLEYCRKIQDFLDDFNKKTQKPYKVTASIGYVAAVPNEQITLDEFIKEADEKMYEDKVRYHSRTR
ncbi:MAG: GGDEF domain-containing protein [Clostridiaceae bacterium]|nr:GGDEF domain-containing protein [Clostridiaceae bacterium]